MTNKRSAWCFSLLLLALAAPVRAGLYNTAEMDNWKLGPEFLKDFKVTLGLLQGIPLAKADTPNPMLARYVLVGDLAHRTAETLTAEQKLNLSDYLIRRNRPLEAKSLLLPLAGDPQANFLVLCNLATACQLLGEHQHAIDYLNEALKRWPGDLADLPEAQQRFFYSIGWEGLFGFYRRVETYQLKLLKLRAREAIILRGKPFETVDALFDDGKDPPSPVQYVSEGGKFEVGKIAKKEKTKLPDDAEDILKQLLIWLPHDARLEWQLAEFYNARGSPDNLRAARTLFNELDGGLNRPLRIKALTEHRLAVDAADIPPPRPFGDNIDEPRMAKKIDKDEEERGRAVDWRTLAVGFGTGLVVGLFVVLQVQEVRRRRHMRQARQAEPAPIPEEKGKP